MEGRELEEKYLEGSVLEDNQRTLKERIRERVVTLRGEPEDWSLLLRRVGDARIVLLGEASHGTHEFYRARAEISKRLIQELGFSAVAVEADWPDAYRLNRYIQGQSSDQNADEALTDFKRFPTWMWRNREVESFITWLRDYNAAQPEASKKVAFYGLDLYSLHASMEAVVNYLDQVDPKAAQRARFRYACFEHYGADPQMYGYAASFNLSTKCEREVVQQLQELQSTAFQAAHQRGFLESDQLFFAEQNARVARNAEEYYRSMFHDDVLSWNLRDRHMAETLAGLERHAQSQGRPAKFIVWEHNSHLGDARATDVALRGELNVGQLVREKWGPQAVKVGFTTYQGSGTAASDWGGVTERKNVRPALTGSFENLFHYLEIPNFLLILSGMREELSDLRRNQLERAIGVVYRPETERISHYFSARLMEQFDAVVHYDQTQAVEPLNRTSEWDQGEAPETFPTGM